MKCIKCNNELGANDKFCSVCGTPVQKMSNEVENKNTYTYDRTSEQQYNYERQFNNLGQQNNNYGQTYTTKNKQQKNNNNITKICISIIVGLIAVAVILVIGVNTYKSTNKDKIVDTVKSNQGNSGTNTTTVSKTNSYKVNYKGFKLYIPDTLFYETNSDGLVIGDAESTWLANFGIQQQVSFQKLKQNKNSLSATLMQGNPGAVASSAKEETIGGVEYLLLEYSNDGMNEIIGFAGLNSMHVAFFEIMNENNDFDRENIKNLSTIISNAEYTGESTYMKSNENSKITGIDKAIEDLAKDE